MQMRVDSVYMMSVDLKLQQVIASAQAEQFMYTRPGPEEEWTKDRADRYAAVIELLKAVQIAGLRIFMDKEGN